MHSSKSTSNNRADRRYITTITQTTGAFVEDFHVQHEQMECSDGDDACTSIVHDCDGVCDGTAYESTWYKDADGDDLGDVNDPCSGCSASQPRSQTYSSPRCRSGRWPRCC